MSYSCENLTIVSHKAWINHDPWLLSLIALNPGTVAQNTNKSAVTNVASGPSTVILSSEYIISKTEYKYNLYTSN